MSKTILIDASNSEQTRIAVTVNDKLDDFEIESNKKNSVKGDVYLAKITRVEPSLQAAFVEFGANRNGFLPLTEIHPDYFKIPATDKDEVKKLYDKLSENNDTTGDIEQALSTEKDDEINLNFSSIGKNKFFYDVIYNPKETNFLKTGKKLGNITENGKLMFIYQAISAFNIWHGVRPIVNDEVIKFLD